MSEERKERMRQRYRQQLRHIVSHDEEKERKQNRRARGRWRDDGDDDAEFVKMHRRPPGSIARPGQAEAAGRLEPNRAELRGTVVWLGRGRARVLAGDEELTAALAPALAGGARGALAVGDEVVVHERTGAEPLVVEVLPRRSELARSDGEHGERHVLATNLDLVVLVLSAERPRIGLIDRLRLATAGSGAELQVCVNKLDLPHDAAALTAALAPYRAQALPVWRTSALRGDGIEELRTALSGRTAALVGHSGVGKSTLLNRLDPASDRATAPVRERDGRGRHTTTASSLRRLADGTQLVDTPGVRLFGLVAEAADAAVAFPELVELAAACRFRDCRHEHEPGCAVRAAVDAGDLERVRYDAYLRLVHAGR